MYLGGVVLEEAVFAIVAETSGRTACPPDHDDLRLAPGEQLADALAFVPEDYDGWAARAWLGYLPSLANRAGQPSPERIPQRRAVARASPEEVHSRARRRERRRAQVIADTIATWADAASRVPVALPAVSRVPRGGSPRRRRARRGCAWALAAMSAARPDRVQRGLGELDGSGVVLSSAVVKPAARSAFAQEPKHLQTWTRFGWSGVARFQSSAAGGRWLATVQACIAVTIASGVHRSVRRGFTPAARSAASQEPNRRVTSARVGWSSAVVLHSLAWGAP